MGIAQLAERLVVVQEVAGSSPVIHPKGKGPLSLLRSDNGPLWYQQWGPSPHTPHGGEPP